MASTRTRLELQNELKDINDILKDFRVPELQAVLSFAQCSRTGRKADLLKRINNLIEKQVPDINNKIREIYRSNLVISKDISNTNLQETEIQKNAINSNTEKQQHIKALLFDNHVKQHYPVILKKLPFYDCLTTLYQPQQLNQQTSNPQSKKFSFVLTPELVSMLQRDAERDQKLEVQLRFCVFDPSHEQDDSFPLNIKVKVNGTICQLPPFIKPGDLKNTRRVPKPINITKYISLSASSSNTITVLWCNLDFTNQYMLFLNLVKKMSAADLLNDLRIKKIIPPDITRNLIKEKLKEDDIDCEIATTMLRVSLICPLGRMRMITPARATTCSHLQCFDASFYLQMNEKNSSWNCPVCYKKALLQNLVIDGYFQQVLSSSNLSTNVNEIELLPDGSWTPHLKNGSVPKDKAKQNEIQIDVDDYKIKLDKNNNNTKNNNVVSGSFVDLTVSDSDDDVSISLGIEVSERNNETQNTNKYYLRKKRATEQVTSKVKKRIKRL